MPSSSVHRSHAKKRSDPTHREVMEKRHAKRRKNEKKNLKAKKISALKEYQRLSKVEFVSKKTTAMNIMEIIEEVKEKLTDGSYLQIMDELMALNKEVEGQVESRSQPHASQSQASQPQASQPRAAQGTSMIYQDDSDDDDYIANYFREYYYHDRIGNQNNIIRENILNIGNINYNTEREGQWYRTQEGTWRREGEGDLVVIADEAHTTAS
jgi:hypothetical protein